jgi:putative modified peptide
MTDAVLTRKQGLMLLQELISNAAFRKRFCDKPAAALLEIGIPAETVVNLSPMCIAPRKAEELASPEELQKTQSELENAESQVMLTMWIPNPKLSAPKG